MTRHSGVCVEKKYIKEKVVIKLMLKIIKQIKVKQI